MNSFQKISTIVACSASLLALPAVAAPLKTLTFEASQTSSIDTTLEEPYNLTYQANGDYLWVVNHGTDSVSVRDASNMRIVRRIRVGKEPQSLAMDEQRHRAFVVNSGDNTLTCIDTTSQSAIEKVELDQAPQMAVVDGSTGAVWITNRDSDTVTVYQRDDNGSIRRFRTGRAPLGIALDATHHRIYVANSGTKSLSVFDSEQMTRLDDIKLPDFPMTVAVNPTTGVVCSTLAQSDSVALTLLGNGDHTIQVEVGKYPINVTCEIGSGLFFVSNYESRSVSVLDSNGQTLDEYETSKRPIGIAVRAQDQRVYVAGFSNSTVNCFDIPKYNAATTVRAERFAPRPVLVALPRTPDVTTAAAQPIVPDSVDASRATIESLPLAPATPSVVTNQTPYPVFSTTPRVKPNIVTIRPPSSMPTPRIRTYTPQAPIKESTVIQHNVRLPVFPSVNAPQQLAPDQPSQVPTQTNLFGGVKPYVAQSGSMVKQLFGVKTVFGIAERASGTSDHPRGLALDFMVGSDSAKGDQIADYMLNNAAQHHVLYIIWKQRIHYPGDPIGRLMDDRGSVTANHFDHVHVSYQPGDN